MLAVKLDRRFGKGQILEMHLSEVYSGHGVHGATAASSGYFGAPPGALSWAQASLLAGLVQAPSRDDPLQHLSIAQARQAHVLDRFVATGVLTGAQAQVARIDALHLRS